MSINLMVTLGTVAYTDWMHVTACKVSAPAVISWETWIDVPVSNYNFIISNLDPEVYYIRYYDAPTNSALGTLVAELVVSALTGDTISERRFYTCGGPGLYDPADGATGVTDPYLIGKTVSGTFKEGFRYFKETDEYTFDDTTGAIAVINGTAFATDEKFVVEIKFSVGTSSSSASGGLYTGTLNVSAATATLLAADINKRIRCVGTAATQVITLCTLASISVEGGYYFDNSCGGTAVQVKILLPGGDRIRFNGFMAASDQFAEFWVSKGEHLLVRKFDATYWEVITDYKGVEVGSRQSGEYTGMPGWMPEDGSLSDGDEFCRIWWWINHILPGTQVITDDAVTGAYVWPVGKEGLFVKHSSLNKFRWPNTQGLSERGLKSFSAFGADAGRVYDYPGGVQNGQVGEFPATIPLPKGNSYTGGPNQLRLGNGNNSPQNFDLVVTLNTGKETRVKNIGVIYLRRI